MGQVVAYRATRNTKGRQSEIQRREFQIRMPAADWSSRRSERYTATFDLLMEQGVHRLAESLALDVP